MVITDTDHYAAGQGDALWAWKSFLRGHNPILMDFGLLDGFVGGEGTPFAAFEPARWAMGDTRRYAERIDLARMPPRGDLTSTDFALASPGHGYLVLEPKGDAKPFRVDLAPGRYDVEWFAVADRRTETGEPVDVGTQGPIGFISPFRDGPSVLYLAQRS